MNTKHHCLIIDNNLKRSSVLESILKDGNISSSIKHTLNCGHGLVYLKEVWEKIRDNETLVILNVDTPIMNGWEFMEELKATPYSKSEKLTLVAMSDNMDEAKKINCEKKGIKNFISSPFSLDCIYSILNESPGSEKNVAFSEVTIEDQPEEIQKGKKSKNKK